MQRDGTPRWGGQGAGVARYKDAHAPVRKDAWLQRDVLLKIETVVP